MKYAFIGRHRNLYPLNRLCEALDVSRSGYYAWSGRALSRREQANQDLLIKIRRIHEQARETYGAVKVWKALQAEGVACGRHRVARLRRLAGIEARRRRRFKVMTHSRCDNQAHWHSKPEPGGPVKATDGSIVMDPGPECGFGTVESTPIMNVPEALQ